MAARRIRRSSAGSWKGESGEILGSNWELMKLDGSGKSPIHGQGARAYGSPGVVIRVKSCASGNCLVSTLMPIFDRFSVTICAERVQAGRLQVYRTAVHLPFPASSLARGRFGSPSG